MSNFKNTFAALLLGACATSPVYANVACDAAGNCIITATPAPAPEPKAVYVPQPAPAPVYVQGREIHNSWKMMCYPRDGAAFQVAYFDTSHTLNIYGRNGQVRTNDIIDERNTGHGFIVSASGYDAKGRSRHLEARFDGPATSYLDVTDRDGPAIGCDEPVPNSDD